MGLFDMINDLFYPYQEKLDTPEQVEEFDKSWAWSDVSKWDKDDDDKKGWW
jgi:hypothetical protein